MTRKIKTLVLALVAVAAMSLAGAVGAQGAQIHANTAGANTTLSGQQTTQHVIRITPPNGLSWTCTTALFQGSASTPKTAQEATITGQYTGCVFFGQAMTINMNGCKFTITGEGQAALTAQTDIAGCTSGKQIEMQTAVCQITVPEQSAIGGHLTFANAGAGQTADVNASITLTGITYQLHGAVCGHAATVTTHDGTYTGSTTFKAFEDVGPLQVTHNGHTAAVRQAGAQVGLTAT